jgi:hypothetical protein
MTLWSDENFHILKTIVMDRTSANANMNTDRSQASNNRDEQPGMAQPVYTEVKNAHAAGDGALGRSEQTIDDGEEGDDIY